MGKPSNTRKGGEKQRQEGSRVSRRISQIRKRVVVKYLQKSSARKNSQNDSRFKAQVAQTPDRKLPRLSLRRILASCRERTLVLFKDLVKEVIMATMGEGAKVVTALLVIQALEGRRQHLVDPLGIRGNRRENES